MREFFKRQRLHRQGYHCGRLRREHQSSEWVETLAWSPYVKGFILAAFLCGLGLIVRYLSSHVPDSAFHKLGDGMGMALMIALIPVSVAHLKVHLCETYSRNSRFLLAYGLIFLQLVLILSVTMIVERNQLGENFDLYFAPVALAPMLLTLLLGKGHGLWSALYGSLWGALIVDQWVAPHFVTLSLISGITGAYATRRLRKRTQLMRAGMYAGLAAVVTCMLLGRTEQVWLEIMSGEKWRGLGMEAGLLMLTGIVTSIAVGGLLPLLESVFRITTTISWLESADLNHPLLRRLTLEAPGTYHHSLMVANLSEAAAERIGADPTLCRVCAYFHDIGKLVKPEYCIENITGDENPHDDLTPQMSALVVMAHVKDGVDIAIKHKLNRQIIDVIQQHHGTSLVYYFYRRALDQQAELKKKVEEGKASSEDVPEVDENRFRYPGPRPSFKESAIISLADAVESASRSLQKPTPQKIEALVDEIVRNRIRDNQLDECDLTVRELSMVKESFCKTLRTALHRRIPYDKEAEKATEPVTEWRETERRPRTTALNPAPAAPAVASEPPVRPAES